MLNCSQSFAEGDYDIESKSQVENRHLTQEQEAHNPPPILFPESRTRIDVIVMSAH
jgi:hypothetical protein